MQELVTHPTLARQALVANRDTAPTAKHNHNVDSDDYKTQTRWKLLVETKVEHKTFIITWNDGSIVSSSKSQRFMVVKLQTNYSIGSPQSTKS